MSPDFVIPPSARIETFFFVAAREQTYSAVICGMPTPATMRVVQIEPGPCPTLIVVAPADARYSTPAALVTLPAMMGNFGKALRRTRTVSPTPLLNPCAVETATTSTQ